MERRGCPGTSCAAAPPSSSPPSATGSFPDSILSEQLPLRSITPSKRHKKSGSAFASIDSTFRHCGLVSPTSLSPQSSRFSCSDQVSDFSVFVVPGSANVARRHASALGGRAACRATLERRRRSRTAVTGAAASKLLPGSGSGWRLWSRSGRNEATPAACQPNTAMDMDLLSMTCGMGRNAMFPLKQSLRFQLLTRCDSLNLHYRHWSSQPDRPANLLDSWSPQFNALRRRYRSSHQHLIRASHTSRITPS